METHSYTSADVTLTVAQRFADLTDFGSSPLEVEISVTTVRKGACHD